MDIDSATSLDVARETKLVSDILTKYESTFHSIGKMKDVKVKLAIDESLTPVAQKHRRAPFHLCDKVDDELKCLFDAGITEPV